MSASAVTVRLGVPGVVTAALCGAVVLLTVVVAARRAAHRWGPADSVTLTRAMLACCVAGLVVDGARSVSGAAMVVAVSSVALALDAVDGRVARSTRPSVFGARLDGEVDAFLMLVLSVHVAARFGGWVLAIGTARYLFWLGGLAWPWLRTRLPFRYWRKVVAATQGVVLTVVSARVLPDAVAATLLVLALGLLVESFGRDVHWAWRHREAGPGTDPEPTATPRGLVPSS